MNDCFSTRTFTPVIGCEPVGTIICSVYPFPRLDLEVDFISVDFLTLCPGDISVRKEDHNARVKNR